MSYGWVIACVGLTVVITLLVLRGRKVISPAIGEFLINMAWVVMFGALAIHDSVTDAPLWSFSLSVGFMGLFITMATYKGVTLLRAPSGDRTDKA